MGIALIAFTSFNAMSQPVKALTEFLGGSPGRVKRHLPRGAVPATRPDDAMAVDPAQTELFPTQAAVHAVEPDAGDLCQPGTAAGAESQPPARGLAARARSFAAAAGAPSNSGCTAAPRTIAWQGMQWVTASAALAFAAPAAANADRFHRPGDPVRPVRAAAAVSNSAKRPESSPSTAARPLLRVLRRTQVNDPARLVISGRMADVCAELDRLAASEARLALP